MKTTPVTPADLALSVMAVPPLALHPDLTANAGENGRLLAHLRRGGVTTVLYAGNANFYNLPIGRLVDTCAMLADRAAADMWVIPAAGPDYGKLMDAAPGLRESAFPTVLVLPLDFPATPAGVVRGVRDFVQALGRPVILYVKRAGYVAVDDVAALVDEGTLCAIKYAVVRERFEADEELAALVQAVDPGLIVSGLGELPAVPHLQTFGLAGFTAGSVCIAPGLSMALLAALRADDAGRVAALIRLFEPLEALRNAISPIRVLHDAVTLSGIAEMGPMLPLLSNLDAADQPPVRAAAAALLAAERAGVGAGVGADAAAE